MKATEILTFVGMMAPTIVVVCFAIFTVLLNVVSATPADAQEIHPQIAYTAVACTVRL
jgi:hypothetical protein